METSCPDKNFLKEKIDLRNNKNIQKKYLKKIILSLIITFAFKTCTSSSAGRAPDS